MIMDPVIERAVVGACAVSPAALELVTVEGAVTPNTFGDPAVRAVFEACQRLGDRGSYTAQLVSAEAEHDDRVHRPDHGQIAQLYVQALTEEKAGAAELMAHVRVLHDLAQRRRWQQAAQLYLDAATVNDDSRAAEAEALLAQAVGSDDTSEPEELAHGVFEYLSQSGPPGISTGLAPLDRQIGGGMRPGDMTAVGGWTNMGKSPLIDGMLADASRRGHRVHLYINEMSKTDRALRLVALDGAAPYQDLVLREVSERDGKRVLAALKRLPFAITDVSTWDGFRIARHIRTHRWDLCALDILHNVQHDGTRELDGILRALAAAARSSAAHLILACHLNEERAKTDLLPFPVARDIRQSGMVKNLCATVLLLHREQERDEHDRVITSNDASLYADKARHGQRGGVALVFDPMRMRFLPLHQAEDRAAA